MTLPPPVLCSPKYAPLADSVSLRIQCLGVRSHLGSAGSPIRALAATPTASARPIREPVPSEPLSGFEARRKSGILREPRPTQKGTEELRALGVPASSRTPPTASWRFGRRGGGLRCCRRLRWRRAARERGVRARRSGGRGGQGGGPAGAPRGSPCTWRGGNFACLRGARG